MAGKRYLDQGFTKRNFQRLLKRKDFFSKGSYRDIKALIPTLEKMEDEISSGSFHFSGFDLGNANGFAILTAKTIEDRIVLRKISDNLKRVFRVHHASRDRIVVLTKTMLSEEIGQFVIKTDIKSFYESLPLEDLIDNVSKSNLLSQTSKRLLYDFKDKLPSGIEGLPRGICVSAVLSEYALRFLDRDIRRMDGVCYYGRFVDDIVIFAYKNPDEIVKLIQAKVAEKGLKLNDAKTEIITQSKSGGSPVKFDFLGYRFEKDGKNLSIDIAAKKVAKIKTRIVKSIICYGSDKNADLLVERIEYLAGNYKVDGAEARGDLISGIHYNYFLVNRIDSLVDLDRFLRFCIHSSKGVVARHKIPMPHSLKSRLDRLTFRSGFEQRRVMSYSMEKISKIRRAWIGG